MSVVGNVACRTNVLVVVWAVFMTPSAGAEESDVVRSAFMIADRNGDRVLSVEELVDRWTDTPVLRRDARLFDIDGDGGLSFGEFVAIPDLVPGAPRGPIPDPFDHLVDAALSAFDDTFKLQTQQTGELRHNIPERHFVTLVVGSLAPDGQTRLDSRWTRQADPDEDGLVSPAEARRFIEIHLGVRGPGGEPLRDPSGRVLMVGSFLRADSNGNGIVEGDELKDPSLVRADRDSDGELTFGEFSHREGPAWFDAVEWFRAADTDLDARLSLHEAESAIEESRHVLIPLCFERFDEDKNGKLSLDEFRLSMLGNPIALWERLPRDGNDDYQMSFDEFQFGAPECELLRLYYFHALDADRSNQLSFEEFPFQTRPSQKLHLLAVDGSQFRELFVNEEYADIGSPAVSPDGARIAFDGHLRGQSLRQQRILMTSIDGSDFQVVCDGLMPTWSRDGKQFSCSRYDPQGIWIINADGTGEKRISDGWGAQWSPDGELISFTKDNGICIYEVKTGNLRVVLASGDHPYRTIYWNSCWSPDSRRLAFKARKQEGYDIASVNVRDEDRDLRVHYSSEQSINPDLAWSADGAQILVSVVLPGFDRQLLCKLDTLREGDPTILEGIDPSLTYAGCCLTPDGQWIVTQTEE